MLRLLAFLSLAPLIGPEPYGLIALATLLVAPFDLLLINAGWFEAVLRNKNVSAAQEASLFWFHASIGLLAVPLILAGAPVLAWLFGEPELVLALTLLATMPLAQGLAILPRAILARALRFRALAMVEISTTVAGFAAALWLALGGQGVLALVALQLVTAWASFVLCAAVSRFLPRPRLRPAEVRPFVEVASRLFGVALLGLVEQMAIRSLLGGVFGTPVLGGYVFARRIVEMIERAALGAVSRVGLAHLGRSDRSRPELVRITCKVALQGMVLTWPLFLFLMLGGTALVAPLVDASWHVALPLIVWSALAGMAQPPLRALNQLLLGCDRQDWILAARAVAILGLLLLIAIAIALDRDAIGIIQAVALRDWLLLTGTLLLARKGLGRLPQAH